MKAKPPQIVTLPELVDPLALGNEILNDSSFWFPETYASIQSKYVAEHFALGMGGELGEFVAEVSMPVDLIDHDEASSELADVLIYVAGLTAAACPNFASDVTPFEAGIFECGLTYGLVISVCSVAEVMKKTNICGPSLTCSMHRNGVHSPGMLEDKLAGAFSTIGATADYWQIDLMTSYRKKRQFNVERWGATPEDHRWFGHPDLAG